MKEGDIKCMQWLGDKDGTRMGQVINGWVWERGTPLAQPCGISEHHKLPHGRPGTVKKKNPKTIQKVNI